MYTRELKLHYKCKCDRCGSWVNDTDRYCPMCGYKAVDIYDPKFDNFSDEQYTQRLIPNNENRQAVKQNNIELKFVLPDTNYQFSIKINKSKLYIGSSPDCSIVVKRNYISRYHALLTYNFTTHTLYISDNDSTNGTFVNEKKINSFELTQIEPNNKISLSTSFTFVYLGSEILNN